MAPEAPVDFQYSKASSFGGQCLVLVRHPRRMSLVKAAAIGYDRAGDHFAKLLLPAPFSPIKARTSSATSEN
jgi:hypothetical protein